MFKEILSPLSLCIMENHRLQPSPSVSSSFLLRPMPLSFLHIFCSGFPLLSEINNNTAVTNPLFSTALVKSRSENSLSKTIPSVALTSKVSRHMISGNWLSLIRPNSFIIISARKSDRDGSEAGRPSFPVSLFSPTFFSPPSISNEKKKKNLKYHRVSGQSFPVPDFSNWREKWIWRERKGGREFFALVRASIERRVEGGLKGSPISLNQFLRS